MSDMFPDYTKYMDFFLLEDNRTELVIYSTAAEFRKARITGKMTLAWIPRRGVWVRDYCEGGAEIAALVLATAGLTGRVE